MDVLWLVLRTGFPFDSSDHEPVFARFAVNVLNAVATRSPGGSDPIATVLEFGAASHVGTLIASRIGRLNASRSEDLPPTVLSVTASATHAAVTSWHRLAVGARSHLIARIEHPSALAEVAARFVADPLVFFDVVVVPDLTALVGNSLPAELERLFGDLLSICRRLIVVLPRPNSPVVRDSAAWSTCPHADSELCSPVLSIAGGVCGVWCRLLRSLQGF
jgi:hypothetical protein